MVFWGLMNGDSFGACSVAVESVSQIFTSVPLLVFFKIFATASLRNVQVSLQMIDCRRITLSSHF